MVSWDRGVIRRARSDVIIAARLAIQTARPMFCEISLFQGFGMFQDCRDTLELTGRRRRTRTSPPVTAIGASVLALMAMTLGGPAHARTDGTCENRLAPAMVVTGSEERGAATIRVVSPESRQGMTMHLDYDGETYGARFDEKGVAQISIAVFNKSNDMAVSVKGIGAVKCSVPFPDIDNVYRVVMQWHDPVKIDLHVIEPFAMEGADGHVYPGRPNLSLDHGLGQLDVVTDAVEDDATAEQSYVVDESRRPPRGIFLFKADYASRGSGPDGEFCGEGKYANVDFTLVTLDHGHKQMTKKYATGVMACGLPLPHDVEFQKMK
jgi:hypothetical protein